MSSLHDGMNLVAKEFIAAREDERGVLVLSQFTGAARELTEALIVNPYDLDEASAALATALTLSPEEQRDRMRSMRAFLAEFNVYRWAGRMLADAARLRSRDRLTGRLTDHLAATGTMRDILSRSGREVLQQFGWSNVLLAFDYDGTLAPIVRDPNKAAMRADDAPAAGRGRDALSLHRGFRPRAVRRPALAAWNPAAAGRRQPRDRALAGHAAPDGRGQALGAASQPGVSPSCKGVRIENKTFSVAVHYRRSREKKKALAAILEAAAALGSVRLIGGKQVVNILPKDAPHKGMALERERERLRHDTAIYVGDDETDEDVFALDQPGRLLTVRVGPKRLSQASYFLRNQGAVDEFLETLLSFRDESDAGPGRAVMRAAPTLALAPAPPSLGEVLDFMRLIWALRPRPAADLEADEGHDRGDRSAAPGHPHRDAVPRHPRGPDRAAAARAPEHADRDLEAPREAGPHPQASRSEGRPARVPGHHREGQADRRRRRRHRGSGRRAPARANVTLEAGRGAGSPRRPGVRSFQGGLSRVGGFEAARLHRPHSFA